MAKNHYNAQAGTANGNIGAILSRKTACGAKATDRAQLYMTAEWEHVDCLRCLAKREEVERIAAHRARMAELKTEK